MPVDLFERTSYKPKDLFALQAPRDLFAETSDPSLKYETFDKENKPLTDMFGTPIPKIQKTDIDKPSDFTPIKRFDVDALGIPFTPSKKDDKGYEKVRKETVNLVKGAASIASGVAGFMASIPAGGKALLEEFSTPNRKWDEISVARVYGKMQEAQSYLQNKFPELLIPEEKTVGGKVSEAVAYPFEKLDKYGRDKLGDLIADVTNSTPEQREEIKGALGIVITGGLAFLPGKAAKTIKKSTWYRKLTVKERGLVVLTAKDLKDRGYSEGQIVRVLPEEFQKRQARDISDAWKEEPKASPEQLKDLKDKFQKKRVEPEVKPTEKGFPPAEDVQEAVRREAGFAPEDIDVKVAQVKSDYWNKKITKEKAYDSLRNLARFSDKDIEFNLERRKAPRADEIIAEAKGEGELSLADDTTLLQMLDKAQNNINEAMRLETRLNKPEHRKGTANVKKAVKEKQDISNQIYNIKHPDKPIGTRVLYKDKEVTLKSVYFDTSQSLDAAREGSPTGRSYTETLSLVDNEGEKFPVSFQDFDNLKIIKPQKQGFMPIEKTEPGFKLAAEEGRTVEGREPKQGTDLFTKEQFTGKLSPEEVKAQTTEEPIVRLKKEFKLYSGIPIDKIFKSLRGKKKPSSKVQKAINDAFLGDFDLNKISDETFKNKGLSDKEIIELRKITNTSQPSDVAFEMYKIPKGEAIKEIPKIIDRAVGVISTRLANIHPSLKFKVRRSLFDAARNTFKDNNHVEGFIKTFSKLSPEQQFNFNESVFNGDFDTANNITSFGKARQTIGFLRKQAKVVGYDPGFIKNYWPRVVGDVQGLLTELRGMKEWTAIDEAIRLKEKELGELTDDQKAAIADTMLRGFPREGVSLKEPFTDPTHVKKRTIVKIPKNLMKYYMPADKALLMYIRTMNGAIAKAKFFGKARKPLTVEPSLPGMETKKQIEDSIGDLVIDLKEKGILKTAEQERDLRGMLYAVFNPKKTSKIVTQLKQGIYALLLTNISPALTQVGDFALTSYKAGVARNVYKVAETFVRTIAKKHKMDLEDIGIESNKIIFEIETEGALGWVLRQGLEWSPFAKIDRFAKRNFLNAALSKTFSEAKRNNKQLIEKLELIFEGEAGQVLVDLKAKNITENVKFFIANDIYDIQPLITSEVPEKFLRVDGGKMLYVLKTYQIKLWDVIRNEAYNEFRKKGGRTGGKSKAFKNFFRLTIALVLMNGLGDQLKDFALGRKTKWEDQFIDQVLRIAGISKYTIWRARRYGYGDAIVKTVAPPVGIIDDVGKDIQLAVQQLFYDEKEEQKYRSIKYVPIFGKPYYWWYGRGADIKQKYQSSDMVDEYNIAIDKGDKKKMSELEEIYKAKHDADIEDKADAVKRYELRNKYKITGNITDIENVKKLAKLPKADRDRLVDTYEYKTRMKLRYYMENLGGQ